MITRSIGLGLFLATLVATTACGPRDADEFDEDGELSYSTTSRGICNATTPCDAAPELGFSTVPGTMDAGEKQYVTAVMRNTGTGIWDSTSIRLNSQHTPRTFWGTPFENVDPNVNPNGLSQHPLLIRAPDAVGTYPFTYQMRDNGQGFDFGTAFNRNIVVQQQGRAWDCANVGALPMRVTAGETINFTVTVQNTGFRPWARDGLFRLCAMDSNTWGGNACVNLTGGGSVVLNQTTTFDVPMMAPAAAGVYPFIRQMRDQHTLGVQFFDDDVADACINTTVIVTLCGNGVIDPGEECDDDNLDLGDGCNAQCIDDDPPLPGRVFDLGTDTTDRTFTGLLANRQLGNVVIANMIGSAAKDVIVGENADVRPTPTTQTRGTAGRVSIYDGDNFFSGPSPTVPANSVVEIDGADAHDHLGAATNGRIAVGDVTGDGINDLVISAYAADGPGNTRTDCGEIYVLVGGASGFTGVIDIGNPPAGVLGTTIIGPEAGALAQILAVGNVGGDATADLVIGLPGHDNANGTDAGTVAIIFGGPSLATGGTIDLATTGPSANIIGPAAGEFFGRVAAIGNVSGSAANDLVLASNNASFGGRQSTGIVWVLRGPIFGARNLAVSSDARFIGEGAFDDLGTSIALGNVSGDANTDLIIGIRQQRNAQGARSGAVDIWRGPLAIGTRDLSTGATPDVRIFGVDAGDNTGSTLAVGQYDGDAPGYLDIAIGASQGDGRLNNLTNAGEVSLVLGSATLDGVRQLSSIGEDILKVYGTSDSSMAAHPLNIAFGDLNSDGFEDLCVGSYRGGANGGGRVDCIAH